MNGNPVVIMIDYPGVVLTATSLIDNHQKHDYGRTQMQRLAVNYYGKQHKLASYRCLDTRQ